MSPARKPAKRWVVRACIGMAVAALLAGGYVVASQTGLADMTAVAAGVLLVAVRARLGAGTELPPDLRPRRHRETAAAEFRSYSKITSDLEWAVLSRRHYEYAIRPLLIRLGASEDDLPVLPPGASDVPGPDLEAFDRIVTMLEQGSGMPNGRGER